MLAVAETGCHAVELKEGALTRVNPVELVGHESVIWPPARLKLNTGREPGAD